MNPDCAGYVVAGGRSSRMGEDKALLSFGSRPLIVRTANLLASLVSPVTIVGSPERYQHLAIRTINDPPSASSGGRGEGPLAGIVAALADSRKPWNLIAACDLPYITPGWLAWLLDRAMKSSAQAVIPANERGLQPLAAVYRRACGPILAAELTRGVRKVTDAIRKLRLEIVSQDDWQGVDPLGLVLKNMNTPQDYQEAQRWWVEQQADDESKREK